MKQKSKQGGARPGAGQKLKYGEATENITIRVPWSQKQAVRELVAGHLQQFQDKKIETQSDVKAKKTWMLYPLDSSGPSIESVKIKFNEPVIVGEVWTFRNDVTGFHWKFKSK
jgi:hypothetical protein